MRSQSQRGHIIWLSKPQQPDKALTAWIDLEPGERGKTVCAAKVTGPRAAGGDSLI